MELIVLIVILAILAAILIPGLLKWIDQAKDKKYELEVREIVQAAEAVLTKMYGQGAGVSVSGGKLAVDIEERLETDLMLDGSFRAEIGKFTDATVTGIGIYGNADSGTPIKWGGSATGFEITFTASNRPQVAVRYNYDPSTYDFDGNAGWSVQ